ncbi:MAG: hypothetical protein QNL91_16015 [Candidatus Krumholzibacteria bacterium]|nr:hypothetical protein [Candidatus Krumholzibacteria bacterium]
MFWQALRNLNTSHFVAALVVSVVLGAGANSSSAETASNHPEQAGGITDKPYLTTVGQGAVLGGYMDMEFEWTDDGSTFDQHRFVPFITGHVSERVTVSAEIEFEHGGNPDADGEVKLEYAVMDFRLSEGLQFRGGVLLSPLGSFNLLHDSPLNDLTARPMVSRQLIPSTLSESGMGFFGTMYPGEESVFSYQAYLVNGFNEGVISGDPGAEKLRVRSGRGSQKQDNNEDKAIVARAGFSPALAANMGLSVHSGKYDDAGEHRLTITALDAKWAFGALELQGEAALVNADVDEVTLPTVAGKQSGLYGQVNYHLLHDAALQGSVFTAVARVDWIDYDTDQDGESEEGFTLGLNFRPTEETVFKMDYNWAWQTPVGGEKGDAEGRFFFSFATYF